MRLIRPILFFLLIALLARPTAAELPAAVARYVNDETLAVARLDIATFSADRLADFAAEIAGDNPGPGVRQFLADMRQTLASAEQALTPLVESGATTVYAILGPATLLRVEPPIIVVPVENDEQARRVSELAGQMGQAHQRVEGAVLVGPESLLRAAREGRPADRPAFGEQLRAQGPALQVVVAASPMVRLALQEAAQSVSGAGLAGLAQSFDWAQLSVSLPPEPRAAVELRFADEPSARRAAEALEAGIAQSVRAAESREDEGAGDELLRQLGPAVRPEVEGATVRLVVDERELRESVGRPLLAAAVAMRDQALRVRAASNLRILGQGLRQFSIDQKGALPANLEEALAHWQKQHPNLAAGFEELMTNPRTGASPGFVYTRPGETDREATPDRVMMYELPPAGAGPEHEVAILFGDGSVRFESLTELERMAREQGFEIERPG